MEVPDELDRRSETRETRDEPRAEGLDPSVVVRGARGFAEDRLGPRSEELLADPANQALVVSRMREGVELEDAVLAIVHVSAQADTELANEFLAYFLGDLLRTGRPMISAGLHRFLDTWDLAQSVLGDLWPQLGSLRFENRARFISLLAQRLSWKATGHARELRRARRREDLRSPERAEDLQLEHESPSPLSHAGMSEDKERLVLILMRLPERDRELLKLHLRGATVQDLMTEKGLSYEAARKALRRAIQRAQKLVEADHRRGP